MRYYIKKRERRKQKNKVIKRLKLKSLLSQVLSDKHHKAHDTTMLRLSMFRVTAQSTVKSQRSGN